MRDSARVVDWVRYSCVAVENIAALKGVRRCVEQWMNVGLLITVMVRYKCECERESQEKVSKRVVVVWFVVNNGIRETE